MTLAIPFLLAMVMSAVLVPICRAVAIRLGYTLSAGEHQPHARPRARLGGVAIALTLFVSAAAAGAFSVVPVLLACSLALFLYGVASELFALKPSTKLVALIAIGAVFLFFDYRLYWSSSLTLDSILTLFWIVTVTSVFNLLDNMDGLCAGTALIAGAFFLMAVHPVVPGSVLSLRVEYVAILLGAVAGFLIYNLHPASILMGDSGSLFVGLNMAAMTLQIAPGRASDLLSIIAVPTLLLLIPFFDSTLIAISRVVKGRPAAAAPGHSSDRLLAMGFSEGAAVNLLWVLAAMSGVIALLASRSEQGLAGLFAVMLTICLALLAVYLARIEVHETADPSIVRRRIRPLGIESGYRRQVVEVLLDALLTSVAYYGAYRLIFPTPGAFAENFRFFFQSFPIVLGTQVIALFVVGAYRGLWRYFGIDDGLRFTKAVVLGTVVSQVIVLYLYRFEGYSPSVFIVYGMMVLLLLVSSRASFRLLSEFVQRQRQAGRRLVICGADDSGSIAVRHLLSDENNAYRIVGFVDDDVKKRHMRVHGYPVIGGYDHLVGMIMAGEIDAVAVTHDGSKTPGLGALCATHGVTLHRLAIDWREIPAVGVVGGGSIGAIDHRVVPFTDVRRERSLAPVTPMVREVAQDRTADPIRVLHIITRLILGGAQENTVYTAIGQHRDPRFDVTLLCGVDEVGEGNMFAQVSDAGVRTVVMPSLLREMRPLTDIKAVFDVYRFLKKGAYAVVHTHSSKAGIIGRIAARAAHVPVVVHTIHGHAFHEFQSVWKNRLFVRLERLCAPMTDKILSVSARLTETALDCGIGRREQHQTVFSGIDLNAFLNVRDRLTVEEAKAQAGIPPDAPVVGKIARFFELKGHEQFLAAAAEIDRLMPGVYYLLVGDGPLREHLRAEATRLGIGDRLVMVGRVLPETVPGYIQAMDVVVHTSLREGIARVLPQAGAVGKPVVTFHLDGAPEVIRDGLSGYLVPALDTNHVAERTVELLSNPERRHAFGEAGRAFASEHFSVERMVERVSTVYLEQLARSTLLT